MNTLFNIANTALQYYRGRQTGLAGLFGIGIAILAAIYWDKLVPVFEALGIISFFDNLGLIKDAPYLTGLNIFMFFVVASIAFSVIGMILVVIIFTVSALFGSLPDQVQFTLAMIALAPFFLVFGPIFMAYRYIRMKLDKHYRQRVNANKNEYTKRFLEEPGMELLLNEYLTEISREQAFNRLNRLPTKGDNLFLLGKGKDGKLYVLIPRPLNVSINEYKQFQLPAGEYEVIKYNEIKHKPNGYLEMINKPDMFIINKINSALHVISIDDIDRFYVTQSTDMKKRFNDYALNDYYNEYLETTQRSYFARKDQLVRELKITLEKNLFDNLVEEIKAYDASNEEIVKMMIDNEKPMEVWEK